MLAVLPVLALCACVLALKARVACWREAMLGGAVVWGVVLVGITELLSAFHGLTVFGLAAAWLVVLVVSVAFAVRARGHRQLPLGLLVRPGLDRQLLALLPKRSADWLQLALFGPLVALVLLLGAIAVISPPNTWDSMTYHMARLIHWSQDAGLAPYPTHILRQLYLQPGAEFALLHLQLLSGGDHLAGLVQWASLVGGLVGTSMIAESLGARQAGVRCAVVFAASLPIGMLEATSTQNDHVVAFWLVCALAFALRLSRSSSLVSSAGEARSMRSVVGDQQEVSGRKWRTPGEGRRAVPWATTAAFGASVGLALLTKAPAYLVVLPVAGWLALCLTRRHAWQGIGVLLVAGAIALALNIGFYARNLVVFGSPIGPLDEGAPSLRYVNAGFSPSLLVSNVVRDVGVNLNATPVAAINVRAVNFVRLVHAWLGVDIADPRTTWGEEVFSEQPVGLAFDENFASNPVHLVLTLFALAAVWPMRRRLSRTSAAYALVVTVAFALFSVVLRWQPWDTRLELPFFVLAAPLVGTLIDRIAPRLAVLLAFVLLVSMVPWVVYNQARPLVGPRSILAFSRDEQYFTNRPSLRSAYLGAVAYLAQRGCARVGFVSTVDGWEYPLWPLLRGQDPSGVEIEQVGVDNVSAAHTTAVNSQFEPCAVVALGPTANMESIDVGGKRYRSSWAQLDASAVLEQVAVLTESGR